MLNRRPKSKNYSYTYFFLHLTTSTYFVLQKLFNYHNFQLHLGHEKYFTHL